MKKNYYFSTGKIDDVLQIVFLCGSKYDKNNKKDKRTILRNYILKSNNLKRMYYPIILESNFVFKERKDSRKKVLLGYDTIGLSSLSDIETLMSIVSDSIIIFHESFSTAGEIAMFATLPDSDKKVHVFVPSPTDVEEDYLQGFLKLAFTGRKKLINNFVYYPNFNKMKLSPNIGKYYSHFEEREFDTNILLKKQIDSILTDSVNKSVNLDFEEIDPYDYICSQSNYLFESKCYWFSKEKKSNEILVLIPFRLLKIIVFSLLLRSETRSIFRTNKKFNDISSDILEVVNYTIINTYNLQKATLYSTDEIKIEVGDLRDFDMQKLVNWCLYMLHGMGLISIVNDKDKTEISIHAKGVVEETNLLTNSYKDLLKDLTESKVGKLLITGDDS